MKIDSLKLIYFSPTDATKKIIESIARGIECSTVEIVDITKKEIRQQQIQPSSNQLLVIGVPVYGGRIPTLALEWLQKFKVHNTPTVCIVVYGNREYDDALLELKNTVLESGCKPIAYAAYIGEHSFSNSETPIASARPDAKDLIHAKSFGEKIKDKLLTISSLNDITDITVPGNYPYIKLPDATSKNASIDFIEIGTSCSHCGICAIACPVGAINFKNNTFMDTNTCIQCCACIKKCPKKARTIKDGIVKNHAIQLSQSYQLRKEPVIFL
ncbi:MAG: hypothetical protein H6Q72_4322 [Firmicutes bacterium]|nr:hypothetical protein [Bacillota bacterium]